MGHIIIRFQDKKDKDKILFPEFTDNKEVIQSEVQAFAVLEAGMVSGKDSVGLLSKIGDKTVVLEMSSEQFDACYHAMKGIIERWSNKK